MKIVNLQTFLKLPVGTVYQKYDNFEFDSMCIKGDSRSFGDDFDSCDVTNEVGDESESHRYAILQDMELGAEYSKDFYTECRDGLFNPLQLFAVWSEQDVRGLVDRLELALKQSGGAA